jgi:hypothetical protein
MLGQLIVQEDIRLPALIDRARHRLAEARTSAEVLEARAAAKAALHYAKLQKAANETQADCLSIIKRAELRMADLRAQRHPRPAQHGDEAGCRLHGRLFELRASAPRDPVLIVEGEKDFDRLAGLGFVATCNAGGANKWPAELNPHFRGLTVCILPDNDDAGRSHAEKVAASLYGVADSVRIVPFPGLGKGGDVSDWLDANGNPEQLVGLCEAAQPWEPASRAEAAEPSADGAFLIPYCDEAPALAFSARHADDLR